MPRARSTTTASCNYFNFNFVF